MLLDHLRDLVVALACNELGRLELVVVLIEADGWRDQLHVDPLRLHVREPLGKRLVESPQAELAGARIEAMPLALLPDRTLVSLGCDVCVHVDHRHQNGLSSDGRWLPRVFLDPNRRPIGHFIACIIHSTGTAILPGLLVSSKETEPCLS